MPLIIVFIGLGMLIGVPLLIVVLIKSVRSNLSYFKKETIPLTMIIQEDLPDTMSAKKRNELRVFAVTFPEFLFMGIAPFVGILSLYLFQEEIHPFSNKYIITLSTYVAITYLSYWISRNYKNKIRLENTVFLSHGMVLGIGVYSLLALHFCSPVTLFGGLVLPFLAFPLFAPLPAILYTCREIKELNIYQEQELLYSEFKNDLTINKFIWRNSNNNIITILLLILLIQSFLSLFGQPIDSLWRCIRESKEFLFSINSFF